MSVPIVDAWGEVVNGQPTYDAVAASLKDCGRCAIGWTDQAGSHYDILFTIFPQVYGNMQGGQSMNSLFVTVLRRHGGSFGFTIEAQDSSVDYVAEKIGVYSLPMTDLINGVRKALTA